MGDKHTNQDRHEPKRPFSGGVDKDKRKSHDMSEKERQAEASRDTRGPDSTRSGKREYDSRRPDNTGSKDVTREERDISRERERGSSEQ